MQFIFKSSGECFGFITNGFLFSLGGEVLGWMENEFIWDAEGGFRGQIWKDRYIISDRSRTLQIPMPPRPAPKTPSLPNPPASIPSSTLPPRWADSF